MKKILPLLTILLAAIGCTNVRQVGNINGLDVSRVTTRGVFSPSQTIVVFSSTNRPGTVDGYMNASGKGVLEAVAQAAATPFEGYLRKPDQTVVKQSGGNANAGSSSIQNNENTATGGSHQNGSTHHNN